MHHSIVADEVWDSANVDKNRGLRRHEDEFFERVRTELERQFPHITAVRVQRKIKHDGDARPIAMILERDFPDMKAIDECLASPTRPRSHEATEKVMKLFDGRFDHYVAEATALEPSSCSRRGWIPRRRDRIAPIIATPKRTNRQSILDNSAVAA